MTTIGIDPGANGGIAVIDELGHAYADKMPETLQDLYEHFDSLNVSHTGDRRAYIEQVHSSPQMGVKSAFTFGNGFGHLEMALTACGIPFERIRPQAWQKALGCMTKGDKNVSKRRAQELFPTLKITHSTADSLLIAEYGRRIK
jgi:Holliday junction resolvasome RuvABC endonuclease subunit